MNFFKIVKSSNKFLIFEQSFNCLESKFQFRKTHISEMPSGKFKPSAKSALPFKVRNKAKRQSLHINRKKALDSARRDERLRRRREEDKDPRLREERLKRNIPLTLERKRVWDDIDGEMGDLLGVSVDIERLKRQKKLEDEQRKDGSREDQGAENGDDEHQDGFHSEDQGAERGDDEQQHVLHEDQGAESGDDDQEHINDDLEENDGDSMIDSGSDVEDAAVDEPPPPPKPSSLSSSTKGPKTATERATSPTQSATRTSTNLDLSPEALASKFPTLFSTTPLPTPKLLITTSLNSTLHHEAKLLTTLFPHSVYIPRSAHHRSHKFSIREISKFATNRHYTSVLVLKEDQKKPTGLTFVHLPSGPTFHFSISNWIEGKKLPGHGNPTNHFPELILNNFRTPLGILAAHLFRSLFPPQPEIQGRQVVTLHNQRDYIFLRRHRYIFREKRATEKSVVGPDGKEVKGVEGIRAGLQELGPRFTMKLRRIDKGIQRASGQEWVWKGGMEKQRTKFQL